MRKLLFTVVLTGISRALILRDRVLGRIPSDRSGEDVRSVLSHHSFKSGKNVLDSVFVKPADEPARAAILLCHGIGETVEHWLPVQQLLAAGGVASLVFDYSGYGRSSGFIDAAQCEADALAAFHLLVTLAPGLPVSLLGFSLGSGVAAAIVPRVSASKLFLCAAFTSLLDAAASIGFPRLLGFLVDPVWNAEESLRHCATPVVIVHGEADVLFPVETAHSLAALCPPGCELLLVPGLTHNQPFYNPQAAYWDLILARLPLNL